MAERRALDSIDPIGSARADYRAAVICWIIALCHVSKGSRPRLGTFLKLFEFENLENVDSVELPPELERIARRSKRP